MKRSFVCLNKNGTDIEFEIEKFVTIKSEGAPVLCLEKLKSGKYRYVLMKILILRRLKV